MSAGKFRSKRRGFFSGTRRLLVEPLEDRRLLATFTVDTLVDEFDGNFSPGDFSLREALFRADQDDVVDTIDFQAGLTGTIRLNGNALAIRKGVNINGPGPDKLTVSGDNRSQVFVAVVFGAQFGGESITVSISGLTITEGNAGNGGGGGVAADSDNPEEPLRLVLNRVNITNNTAFFGGGIFAEGSVVTILNSSISRNVAQRDGGGVRAGAAFTHDPANPTFLLINSTVSGNQANRDAGGVSIVFSAVEFRNSTITGNRADADGNNDGDGGGISLVLGFESSIRLKNTIVAGNLEGTGTSPSDFGDGNAEADSANNLIGDTSTSGGLTNGVNGNIVGNGGTGTRDITTVLDRTLINNGGATPTHSLVPGSPALDKGDNALAVNQNGVPLTTDQRGGGFARIVDGPDTGSTATIDIGAYEAQPRTLTVSTLADESDLNLTPGDFSLREAIQRANANASRTDVINFQAGLAGEILLGGTQLLIREGLTINGPPANAITVSGNNQSRVMVITGGATVVLSSFVITEGLSANGGGIFTGPGTFVTLNRMTITGNRATFSGGGVLAGSFLAVNNSTISNNAAGTNGGGIHFDGPGTHFPNFPTLWSHNSTFSGNFAKGNGGGVYVFDNAAQFRSSTFAGNIADSDGNGGNGGGIFTRNNANTSTTVFNTIVAGNARGAGLFTADDLSGKNVETVSTHNLIGDASTAGGLTNGNNGNIVGDAGTGTIDIETVLDTGLRLNGGPTPTHALKIGSPAIDAGDNNRAFDVFTGDPLLSDQRGSTRIRDGNGDGSEIVDIGAFEVDPPVIASFGDAITYTENDPPLPISSTVTVTDPDSPNFALGRLTVRFTAGGRPEDRLTIRTSGNISTDSNNKVLFAGQIMGTFSGGVGTTPLVIAFNDQATPSRVQLLLRNIVYSNVSDDPFVNDRTVSAQVTDGDGGSSAAVTKTISVVSVQDAPTLAPADGGTVGYQQNTAQIALLSNATVTDPDSLNFAGGRLLVRIISGGDDSNRLLIGAAFDVVGNEVQRNGQTIGTLNADGGVGTTRLEITFNANATVPIVELLVQAIRFRTVAGTSTAQRVIEFSVSDGDGGGVSNRVNKTVNVT